MMINTSTTSSSGIAAAHVVTSTNQRRRRCLRATSGSNNVGGWMNMMTMTQRRRSYSASTVVVHTTILLVPFISIMIIIFGGITKNNHLLVVSGGVINNNVKEDDVTSTPGYSSIQSLQDSIVQTSSLIGFDKSEYKTITDEPYATYYKCQPRKIHLSQANNVNQTTQVVSMYISFTLDYINCSNNVKPRIIYGRLNSYFFNSFHNILSTSSPSSSTLSTTTSSSSSSNDGDLGSIEKLNFTYVSPKTKEHYQSDWIYHAKLDNLNAGLTEYWYRIIVDDEDEEEDEKKEQEEEDTATHHHRNSNKSNNSGSNPSVLTESAATSTITTTSQQERSRTLREESRSSSFSLFGLRGSPKRNRRIVGETPTYTFKTPPYVGKKSKAWNGDKVHTMYTPTNLALVGDIGQTENSCKTMNHILTARNLPNIKHPISAIIIAGDLSYADSDPHRWETWLDLMVCSVFTSCGREGPASDFCLTFTSLLSLSLSAAAFLRLNCVAFVDNIHGIHRNHCYARHHYNQHQGIMKLNVIMSHMIYLYRMKIYSVIQIGLVHLIWYQLMMIIGKHYGPVQHRPNF